MRIPLLLKRIISAAVRRSEMKRCLSFILPLLGAKFSALPRGVNAAPCQIRWENETQADSAYWHVLLLYLILDSNSKWSLFFLWLFIFLSSFPFYTFHNPTSVFWLPCGISASQGVHICVGKSSHIPLLGFAWACVWIWSCCGILQPLMACFLTWSEFELRKIEFSEEKEGNRNPVKN